MSASTSVTSPQILNHYLQESPSVVANQFKRRALLWDIAAKVSLVAIFAITASILVITVLGAPVFSGWFIALSIGIAVATPLLFRVERLFASRCKQARTGFEVEFAVEKELKRIEHWSTEEIASFYRDHHIQKETDRSLLPLIARFNYWKQIADASYTQAILNLDASAPDNKLVGQSREIRYITRQMGEEILENQTLPAKLQCAVMLQLLSNPAQEIDLDQIGKHETHPFDQTWSERLFDGHDVYFEFKNDHAPLSCKDIELATPEELQGKLFS